MPHLFPENERGRYFTIKVSVSGVSNRNCHKFSIWAASSEFVSSSIPSLQILTAHSQPFRGARDQAF